MRSIESAEELEQKERRKRTIVGIALLAIMVVSSAGYAFISYTGQGNQQTDTSSQQGSLDASGRWSVNIGGQPLSFSSAPTAVASVPLEFNLTLNDYTKNPFTYVASDSDSISYEIGSTLGKYVRLQAACYGKCEKDLPEKNCTSPLIVWNQSLENRVYQRDNCVFIEGDIRAVDAFLYSILGIKQ